MSMYTTGEIARLCGVTVRTVQYYDTRGVLTPSELSEGGRRLYSETDLNRMKIICFLRGLELPIDSIGSLLREEHPEQVISLLLDEQEKTLQAEIAAKQEKANRIAEVKKALRQISFFTVESIGDIANIMERRKQLRRLHIMMIIVGLVMDAIQVSTLMVWILTGKWLPFALGMMVAAILGVWISYVYFTRTAYICPECHGIFRPRFKEAFFARHTPCTRKLTCTCCGHHGFCVETYGRNDESC